MKRGKGTIAVVALSLFAAGWLYGALRFRFPRIELLEVEIPERVLLGEEFPLAFSVLPHAPFPPGASLFIHFAGGETKINADVAIPLPMRRWSPGETARLGPFYCVVPAGAPPGRYAVEAGLFYQGRDWLGRRGYVRIPWANRTVRNWHAGSIEAARRPPREWTAADFGPGGYAVGIAGPLDKVFPNREEWRGPPAHRVEISAARNEYESFQVVVAAGEAPLKGVRVAAGELRGPGLIGTDQIEVRCAGWVETRRPYYNVPRTGPWPDPLLPVGGGGVDVEPGRVRSFWVTVFVPPGTPPGEYRGTVTVAPEGVAPAAVDLTLRVWGFELPATPTLKTGFDFYEYLVRRYYPRNEGEGEADWRKRIDALCRDYYLDMLRHRISPIHNVGNPSLVGVEDGGYLLDFAEFDRRVEGYLAAGQTDFGIAIEARVVPDEGIWSDGWYGFTGPDAVRGVFRSFGKHLERRGWMGRAYTYVIDETYRGVESLTRLIHEGHPGIRTMLTCTPEEGYPNVDIWCIRLNNFDGETARRFRDRGKEIWLYVASPTRPFPTIILDSPSIETRIIPWICRRAGATGLVYWCVNYWHLADPMENPMTWPDQNGNGSLYYPHPSGPVGSIRLEVLRDGMEDYEYLRMAAEKKAGRELEERVAAVAASGWDYSRDPERLLRTREALGRFLDAAARLPVGREEAR